MGVIASSVAVLLAFGYFLPSQPIGALPEQVSITNPATFRFIHEANVFTDRSEVNLYITASQTVKDDLFNELMKKLEANPRMELEGWDAFLLLMSGESVRISRTWPDGHEMTIDELKEFLDFISTPHHGKLLSPNEAFAIKGITVKRYWAPGHSHKQPAQ